MNIIALVLLSYFYLPESIKFSLDTGRISKAKEDLKHIYIVNKTSVGET